MPLNWGYAAIKAQMIARQLRQAGLADQALNLPIIYLPGILGSKLYDRRKKSLIWGNYKGIFSQNDYEYRASNAEPIDLTMGVKPLHAFNIIPGLLDTLVTAELKFVLQQALGYREGIDLFFLAHDWRADHRQLALLLDMEIQRIRQRFGEQQKIILVGQLASNYAIRYYLQSTNAENRQSIAKWYAFGPPWAGTFHALSMLETGYYAGSKLFHGFSPDDIASYPSTYQLLPSTPSIIDKDGKPIENFDIYDAECWKEYRLGPYRNTLDQVSEQGKRARIQLADNLQNAKSFTATISASSAEERSISQVWYLSDNHLAVKSAIYDGGRWYLKAKEIQRHYPHLASIALAPGDDHIDLNSLLNDWEGPLVRDRNQHPWGNAFISINQAKDHRALINHTPNLRSLAFDIATVRRQNNGG